MSAMTIDQVKQHIAGLKTMSELKPEDYCEEGGIADSLAQTYRKGSSDELKPTQLYKVFQEIKHIEREVRKREKNEDFDRSQVLSLLPIMAYNTARRNLPPSFYEILRECLSSHKLHTNGDFLRMAEFITAVLAYHKYRSLGGGK